MADKKEYMTKIGALWTRTSKDGKTQYMSGQLQDLRGNIPIVCFLNGKKEKQNQPDLIIYLQNDKEEGAAKTTGARMPGGFAMPTESVGDSIPAGSLEAIAYPEDELDPAKIPF